MADESIASEIAQERDWTVLALTGKLYKKNVDSVEEKAESVLASCAKIAVDLEKVTYLSSAGIRILIRLAKKAAAGQKTFALCGAEGLVKEVVEETHMNMLVKIYQDRSELG